MQRVKHGDGRAGGGDAPPQARDLTNSPLFLVLRTGYSQDMQLFSLVLSVFSTIVAIICGYIAVQCLARANIAEAHCQKGNKRAKLAALECEMAEMSDSIESVTESVRKLRSRAGMRELRARKKTPQADAQHDLNTQEGRDAARTELEIELASQGKLNSRYASRG